MSDDVRLTLEAVPRAGLSAGQLRQAVAAHPGVLSALEVADADRLITGPAPTGRRPATRNCSRPPTCCAPTRTSRRATT
ncbi:hypothetical protein [Nonomuraea sp. NPDC049750]|uniref:hypothetical protein n=1 Tax=Nonomuraea sp. NPDC049750 TaxID=3154738 RepID=UPI0033F7DD2A